MAIYLVAVHEGDVIAVGANYSLRGFLALAETLAATLEGPVAVCGVRLNVFHEPLTIGEKFDPSKPGARIVDQTWCYGEEPK